MARKVILYTDNGTQSIMARNYLSRNNVDFEEINITKKGSKMAISKYRLPFLQVRASHRVSAVSGFDEFKYSAALNSNLSYNDFTKAQKTQPKGKQVTL